MTINPKVIFCKYCPDAFLPNMIKWHMETVHKKFEFICSRCGGDTSGMVIVSGEEELCMDCAQK